jgi:hypothetical protein
MNRFAMTILCCVLSAASACTANLSLLEEPTRASASSTRAAGLDLAFGPSIKAIDSRTLFNHANFKRWFELRKRFETIKITWLHLSSLKPFTHAPATSNPLDDNQLGKLARLQSVLGLKVSVEGGIGLSGDRCLLAPEELGRAAAEIEHENTVQRLLDAGVTVHKLKVDGPFLRLIHGSRKNYSCHQDHSRGLGPAQAAIAVDAYLTRLQQLAPGVEFQLLINLVNWRYNNYMELAWGQQGYNQPQNLQSVLDAFATRYAAQSAYTISKVEVDYPYYYVETDEASRLHRKLTGTGTDFVYVPGSESFLDKVYQLRKQLTGFVTTGEPPSIAVVANTRAQIDDSYADGGRFTLQPFDGKDYTSLQRTYDQRYLDKSEAYFNHLLDQNEAGAWHLGTLSGVALQSWHANTFYTFHPTELSYASGTIGIVDRRFPTLAHETVWSRRRYAVLDEALSHHMCSEHFLAHAQAAVGHAVFYPHLCRPISNTANRCRPSEYLALRPDVRATGLTPTQHYTRYGRAAGLCQPNL